MHTLCKEKDIFNRGYKYLGAIDEAGRGPLAGPVVAACVLIKSDFQINDSAKAGLSLVKDSKKIAEKNREEILNLSRKSSERLASARATTKRLTE